MDSPLQGNDRVISGVCQNDILQHSYFDIRNCLEFSISILVFRKEGGSLFSDPPNFCIYSSSSN